MTSKEFASKLADRLKHYDALAVKDIQILGKAKNDIVRDFILRSLIESWSQANNIFLKQEEIETSVAEIRKQYPDEISFRQKLVEENLTYELWLKKLKFSLLQKKVMRELVKDHAEPSESEIKTYYENHSDDFKRSRSIKIQQVVLNTENDAKTIRSKIKKGKKLGELARKFSIAPEAEKDGIVGWVDEGTLEVFDSVLDQPKKSLSGVLKSPYGYHIIKILDKRGARTQKFEDSQKEIYKILIQNREQAAYSKWLEAQVQNAKVLKDEAFIENLKVETRGEL
jgi:peptidyl-prolyl cis-trans isomerase C